MIAHENEVQYSRMALAHDLRPIATPAVLFLPAQARLMRKELREILRDWRTIVTLVLMPSILKLPPLGLIERWRGKPRSFEGVTADA